MTIRRTRHWPLRKLPSGIFCGNMNWRLPYASLGITPYEDKLSLHYPRAITEAMILSIRIYAHYNLVHPLDLPSRIKRVILCQPANAFPLEFSTTPYLLLTIFWSFCDSKEFSFSGNCFCFPHFHGNDCRLYQNCPQGIASKPDLSSLKIKTLPLKILIVLHLFIKITCPNGKSLV